MNVPPASNLPNTLPAPIPSKLKWWSNARFGLFIHWGPISLMGKEISWSRDPNPSGPNPGGIPATIYDSLYKQFNPVKFNATQIANLAKETGMKYIVFTCKHHDGFCEFDSQYTDYKITSQLSPYGKDIVGQLANASHKANLHWCVYYSPPDLHNPDYVTNQKQYDIYFHHQVLELLKNYGKTDLVWFDGLGHSASFWDAATLFQQMRAVNPSLIINDRCGLPGDYSTPEQTVGKFDDQHPWETCMTIGNQWAFDPNDVYKSSVQCIQTLAKCVGGDGNLLLNIGLRPDGTVDPTQEDRLHALGKWMKVNGPSVYGTRGGPYLPGADYVSTHRGRTVFIHILQWHGDSIELPPLPMDIVSAQTMDGSPVKFVQTARGVVITVPSSLQDSADTVIALKLIGNSMKLSTIPAS